MYGIGRLIILWVSVALNITAMILQMKARKRYMELSDEYGELAEQLKLMLEQETRMFLKLKEIENDNRNNDNSSSSC